MGENYTTIENHTSKKAARNELSRNILQKKHPGEYERFVEKERNKLEILEKLKLEIIADTLDRAELMAKMRHKILQRATEAKEAGNRVTFTQEKVGREKGEGQLLVEKPGQEMESTDWLLYSDYFCSQGSQRHPYEFVRDEDVEEYLRGLLWNLRMYVDGVCPDITYSFSGRVCPAPSRILRYLDSHLDDYILGIQTNSTKAFGTATYLQNVIKVPKSSLGPLSSEATSICVIPRQGANFISSELKGVWAAMQSLLQGDENEKQRTESGKSCGLENFSYSSVVERLIEVWDDNPPQFSSGPRTVGTDPVPEGRRIKKQKRLPRTIRKNRGHQKFANRLNNIGVDMAVKGTKEEQQLTLCDFYNDEQFRSECVQNSAELIAPQVMATERDSRWTVICDSQGESTVSASASSSDRRRIGARRRKGKLGTEMSFSPQIRQDSNVGVPCNELTPLNKKTQYLEQTERQEVVKQKYFVIRGVPTPIVPYKVRYSLPWPLKMPELPKSSIFQIPQSMCRCRSGS